MQKISKALLLALFMICLTSALFVSASAQEVTLGDFVFDVNGTVATVKEYKGDAQSVTIPSKVGNARVTTIGNEAFWGNTTMKAVTIPSTVTVIGSTAFTECSALTRVNIPKSVTTLGDAVFWYCTSLKQVFIPAATVSMGENLFVGCHSELTVYVVKGSYGESFVKKLSGINMAYRYITGVTLNKTAAKLEVGQSLALRYTYTPSKVYYSKLTYSSSNTAVATVSSSGKITAKGVGTAVISCKTADNSNITVSCRITVVPEKADSFYLTDVTPTGYTLRWEASKGATRYRVYRYNSSTKKYETVKYTSTPYYKAAELPAGSYQYYKVLAYTSSGNTYYLAATSATYKAYTARPGAVEKITAKPAHNFINLSWDKVPSATGYRIFSYNKATGKYTAVVTTKATSYKVRSLTPDTEYTYMIRAYISGNGATVWSAYSPLTDCTTRPDYVSGLRVKENSVYTTRLTLEWELLEGAEYMLYRYDEQSASYKLLAALGEDTDEYTVNGLAPGEEYLFKIRAVSTSGLAGYLQTEPLRATTGDRPADEREAFDSFLDAFNASKNSELSLALISSSSGQVIGENADKCENVLSLIAPEQSSIYYIVSGKDSESGKSLTELIQPFGKDSLAEYDMLLQDSTLYEDDGNGYRISFTLSKENASELVALPDADEISNAVEGLELTSLTASDVKLSAKVHNGYIDDLTAEIPLQAEFTLGEAEYSFSITVTQTYLFIR